MKNLMQFKNFLSKRKGPITTVSLLSLLVVGFQNCQKTDDYFQKEELGTVAGVLPPGVGTPLCSDGSSKDLICNPLDDKPATNPKNARSGLIAHLYEGQPDWNHLDRYFAEGYKHPEDIYFSNFSIETRAFSEGFNYGQDDYLKNQAGDKLVEWFAIRATGNIVLPENKEEGKYHIVTMSDDGINVSVDGKVIVSNPNIHATTIDCANQVVSFAKGDRKDFALDYFQGPRFHIALVTMIKKVESDNFMPSSVCSTYQGPSALTAQGYEVMGPEWFELPDDY